MSGHPWYARYPQDFIMGTMGMTLEERGAYSIALDLIYDRQGPIPDDDRWLAGVMGVSLRKWKAIRSKLIDAGKLVSDEGFLTNLRAEKEIEKSAKLSRKRAENGAKGGSKRAENERDLKENSDLDQAGLKPIQSQPQPPSSKEDSPPMVPQEQQAVDAWNALADDLGFPKVQKLTSARKSKLRARLNDCGGIEGWKVAMAKIRASPFLSNPPRNGKHTNWRPDFDFILSESKFTKLMEGGYDDRSSDNPDPGTAGTSESDAAILRAVERVESQRNVSTGGGSEGGY